MYNNFDIGTGSQKQKKLCDLRKMAGITSKYFVFQKINILTTSLTYWSKLCLNQSLYNISHQKKL